MMPSFTCAVDATSDISDRVRETVSEQGTRLEPSRAGKLREVREKAADLRSRGLLRRREFVVVTTSDFERRYMSQKKLNPLPPVFESLAGPEAGYVTGASLTIDGGFNA